MIITRRKLIKSAAIAAPALILPSRKLLARRMHGKPSGGGGYAAKAFEIPNMGGLQQLSTTLPDTDIISGCMWTNYSDSYLNWGGQTFITLSAPGAEQGFEFYNYQHVATDLAINVVLADQSEPMAATSASGVLTSETWFIGFFKYNSTTGVAQLWKGDTDVFSAFDAHTFPTSIPINGTILQFGDGTNAPNDPTQKIRFSNIWISTMQDLDWSSQSVRRKFLGANGKPVDLGANGTGPTGVAPEICFTGDANGGSPLNIGTCGAFTGTGPIVDYTPSPST